MDGTTLRSSGRWARVRLTTAFNRILQLPGASVRTVAFTDQGLVIRVTPPATPAPVPWRRDHESPLRLLAAPVAAPGLWGMPGVAGGRHPPHRLPHLRTGPHRAGAVGDRSQTQAATSAMCYRSDRARLRHPWYSHWSAAWTSSSGGLGTEAGIWPKAARRAMP